MNLPIEEMLADADRAWDCRRELTHPDTLMGDMSCHVRALAAEVARLEASNYVLCDTLETVKLFVLAGCDPAGRKTKGGRR